MANVLQFPARPSKIDFSRARKSKRSLSVAPGQISLFSQPANVLEFPAETSLFEQALRFDENNEFREAEDLYLKAIAAGDFAADANCNLGIIESKKGNFSKAFDCFTQSLKLDPRHTESHYNLGNLYFDLGDFRLAAVHYELATEADPLFPSAYFNLGLVRAITHNLESAIQAFIHYQELAPPEEGGKADELLTNLRRSVHSSD